MTESQVLEGFWIVAGFLCLVARFYWVISRNRQRQQLTYDSIPRRIPVANTVERDTLRQELIDMLSRALDVRREKLEPQARFDTDLRTPPGILNDLLEEVQFHFDVQFDTKSIKTVGDLLNLVQQEAE